MTIRYTLSPDDYAEFTDWYYDYQTTKNKTWQKFAPQLGVFLFFTWFVLTYYFYQSSLMFFVLFVAVFLLSIYMLPKQQRKEYRKATLKQLSSKDYATVFGSYGLEISAEGVMTVTQKITALSHWDLVEHIEVTEGYAFFLFNLNGALVIPRSRITEGDFDSFVTEARRLLAEANDDETPIPAR